MQSIDAHFAAQALPRHYVKKSFDNADDDSIDDLPSLLSIDDLPLLQSNAHFKVAEPLKPGSTGLKKSFGIGIIDAHFAAIDAHFAAQALPRHYVKESFGNADDDSIDDIPPLLLSIDDLPPLQSDAHFKVAEPLKPGSAGLNKKSLGSRDAGDTDDDGIDKHLSHSELVKEGSASVGTKPPLVDVKRKTVPHPMV
jgi:hypothetical protein